MFVIEIGGKKIIVETKCGECGNRLWPEMQC